MKTKFGNILKYLRNERGISQQQLADYLNVSRAAIAGYETQERQPDIDKLLQIADYFAVSVDYLIGKQPSPSKKAHDDYIQLFFKFSTIQQRQSLYNLFSNIPSTHQIHILTYILYCRQLYS